MGSFISKCVKSQTPLVRTSFVFINFASNMASNLVPTERIENYLGNELRCKICLEYVIEARILDCNHYFCRTCLIQWLKTSKSCPRCQVTIDDGKSSPCPAVDRIIVAYFNDQVGNIVSERATQVTKRKKIMANMITEQHRMTRAPYYVVSSLALYSFPSTDKRVLAPDTVAAIQKPPYWCSGPPKSSTLVNDDEDDDNDDVDDEDDEDMEICSTGLLDADICDIWSPSFKHN